MDTDSRWTLFFLAVLILISAFFSASEMALSAVNRMRLRTMAEDGDKRAALAARLADRFDRTLPVILIGNNVVNIGATSAATAMVTQMLGASGVAVATFIMTIVILVFGEVLPKSIAKENSEQVALFTSRPLSLFVVLLSPIAWLFTKLQEGISVLCGSRKNAQPLVTEQELRSIIETSEEEGVLDEQRSELMQSALTFDGTTVQEVLTPRVDLVAVNIDDPPQKIKELILGERFSRMPVFEKNLDNIIGILQTRDYLEAALNTGLPVDLRPLLSKPVFVHKTQRIAALLNDFKQERVHIAVVTDDYGGTMGIVSMEDLLEELVGEIWDEDEEEEQDFVELEPGVYQISGDYPVEDALERIGFDGRGFESEYSSVGGWAFERLGRVPDEGDTFEYNGISVRVDKMEEQRVVQLTVRYLPPQ